MKIVEIIEGLWANPKEITRIQHSLSGRIMIYSGHGGYEKCFYNENIYTKDEFRKHATRIVRIVALSGAKVVVKPQPEPQTEPRRYFNPPNVIAKR